MIDLNNLRLKDLIVELECLGENNGFDDKVVIKENEIIVLDKNGNKKDSFETMFI